MKPRYFLKTVLLLLVVMVITDTVSGDSLSSLLKRRKKITTTTAKPEIPEEEGVIEHQKGELNLPVSLEETKVEDVQVKPVEKPLDTLIEPNVNVEPLKTVVPVRRKFSKGKGPHRKKRPVLSHGQNDNPTTSTTTVRAVVEDVTETTTEKFNVVSKEITATSTVVPVRRKLGKGKFPYRKREPAGHKEDEHVEVSTKGNPLGIEVTEKANLSKEVTTTTERSKRRKFGKGQNKSNESVMNKEDLKIQMSERRKIFKSKRPRPGVLDKTTEVKYIPLVDDNGDDIKLAASQSVEQEVHNLSVESSSSVEGASSVEVKPREKGKDEGLKLKVKHYMSEIQSLEVQQKKEELPAQKVAEVKVEEIPASPEEPENKDRVVTEFMLFRTGVPVDYSYNETVENPGDIVSSNGCPKSIDGYPWVLYKDVSSSEPKCYLVGQHSLACHGSAVMNYQRASEYGVCACNFQECLTKRNMPLNPTSAPDLNGNQLKRRNGLPGKLRYRFCRPMGVNCEEFVYDQKEKRCDIMYSQGPCKKHEWLQRNSKGGVECAQRLCDSGSGLSEKSEDFQRSFGNITEDNAECCKPWGGLAVAGVLTRLSTSACEPGQIYSEALKKCLSPFKLSSLIVG